MGAANGIDALLAYISAVSVPAQNVEMGPIGTVAFTRVGAADDPPPGVDLWWR